MSETLTLSRKKDIKREFWGMSYPGIIAFTLQSFYDIVDMIWVGKLSKEAMAGVTLFTTIFALFSVLNEVAGSSSVSMISQSHGRGTSERTQKIAEQTITFKVVLAIITGLLIYITLDPLLNLYSDDPLVVQSAKDYGIIRIFSLPFAFTSYSINTIFRCTGDSKTPMKIMLTATITNMVLDPLFIFEKIPGTNIPGLNLGVFGAGLATVISIIFSCLIGGILLSRYSEVVKVSWRGLLSLDKEIDLQLLSIGLPSGVQLFIRMGFNAVLMIFITIYGTTAITVYGLGTKLMQFAFSPLMGFSFAGSIMVGHALGREDIEEARYMARIATAMIFGIIGVATAFAEIFPEFFIALFNTEADVLEAGVPMLRWISIALLLASVSAGMRVVFSGSGFNRPILISTLISRWLVQLPALYLMTRIFELPLHLIWISFVLAELADLLVVIYYYCRGDWKYKRV